MLNYEIIYDDLKKKFNNAECELKYTNAYELLIAVILSAQCTDKRVNKVTPELFNKYPTPNDMVNADILELQRIIHSCGFYNNKSKNIIECCRDIVNKFNGEVPNNLDDLTRLSGVGRKTANVVLSTIYKVPAIAVDTHVFRVSNRLGLADAKNVDECEKQLMNNLPKELWSQMHYLLVLFGRYYCKSRNPNCENCTLKNICKEYICREK